MSVCISVEIAIDMHSKQVAMKSCFSDMSHKNC